MNSHNICFLGEIQEKYPHAEKVPYLVLSNDCNMA